MQLCCTKNVSISLLTNSKMNFRSFFSVKFKHYRFVILLLRILTATVTACIFLHLREIKDGIADYCEFLSAVLSKSLIQEKKDPKPLLECYLNIINCDLEVSFFCMYIVDRQHIYFFNCKYEYMMNVQMA